MESVEDVILNITDYYMLYHQNQVLSSRILLYNLM